MKGLSELLIIIVTLIVILIAALVVVGIFSKGVKESFDTATTIRATADCQFKCAALCQQNQEGRYGSATVRIGDADVPCGNFVACTCAKKDSPGVLGGSPIVAPKTS